MISREEKLSITAYNVFRLAQDGVDFYGNRIRDGDSVPYEDRNAWLGVAAAYSGAAPPKGHPGREAYEVWASRLGYGDFGWDSLHERTRQAWKAVALHLSIMAWASITDEEMTAEFLREHEQVWSGYADKKEEAE